MVIIIIAISMMCHHFHGDHYYSVCHNDDDDHHHRNHLFALLFSISIVLVVMFDSYLEQVSLAPDVDFPHCDGPSAPYCSVKQITHCSQRDCMVQYQSEKAVRSAL